MKYFFKIKLSCLLDQWDRCLLIQPGEQLASDLRKLWKELASVYGCCVKTLKDEHRGNPNQDICHIHLRVKRKPD